MEETSLTDFQDETPDESETTSAFVPAGADCERCGEPATRLWLDDGTRVCGACKPW